MTTKTKTSPSTTPSTATSDALREDALRALHGASQRMTAAAGELLADQNRPGDALPLVEAVSAADAEIRVAEHLLDALGWKASTSATR